jgi:hypothetical protein
MVAKDRQDCGHGGGLRWDCERARRASGHGRGGEKQGEADHTSGEPILKKLYSTDDDEDHVWFEDRWMVASLCDE